MRTLTHTAATEELAMSKEEIEVARSIYVPFLKILLIVAWAADHKLPASYLAAIKDKKNAEAGLKFFERYKFPKTTAKIWLKGIATFGKTGDYEAVEDDFDDVCIAVKDKLGTIAKDAAIPREILSVMKDVSLYLRTFSDPAIARLSKTISVLNDVDMMALYTDKKVEKPNDAKEALKKMVSKLTGKPGLNLTPQQVEEIRAKKPVAYKSYLEAKRALTTLTKKRISQIVRGAGKPLFDASLMSDQLKKEGFASTIPLGYVGKVDEQGKLYTSEGKMITGVPGGSVKMNPKYDAKKDNTYPFTAIPFGGDKAQRYYTVDYRKDKNVQKFKKVGDLTEMIDELRSKWGAALMKDEGRNQIAGLILELAYQTHGRIGNPTNQTDGKSTYGLSTLLGKHVTMMGPNKARLKYVGKSGIPQQHLMIGTDRLSKKAVALIAQLKAESSPDAPFFTYRNRPVNGQFVNIFLKSLNSPVTIHKIRTMKGTLLAKELLAKNPFAGKKNVQEKAVTEWLKKKLTEVGRQLGHMSGDKVTPMTAIKSYINSDIIQEFYDKAGVRPPAQIEKIIQHNTELK